MKKYIVLIMSLIIFSVAVAAIEVSTLETGTASDEASMSEISAADGITVMMTGFRNDKGAARINLFSSEEGFPTEPSQAYMAMMVPIKNRTVEVTFMAVPSGEYAISVIHDEMPTDKLMTSWLDIPAEGYGSTAKTHNQFARPTFWGAAFKYIGQGSTVKIKVSY